MEDYICAMGMHRYGYGFWDLIKNDIQLEKIHQQREAIAIVG